MKKYLIFFTILLTNHLITSAQKSYEQDLTSLATLVSIDNKSFGSGIFIADSSEIFFATARHVLYEELVYKNTKIKSYKLRASKIELFFYPKDSDFKVSQQIDVQLDTLIKTKQFTMDHFQDICIFKVADINENKIHLINGVSKKSKTLILNAASYSMVRPYTDVEVGDNLYVIGYPKALGLEYNEQYDFNKPLVRNGIVGGKNDSKQTIIIDCPVYGGNSGGPVFITERIIESGNGKITFSNKIYLIGIVSQFIPWINSMNDKCYHIDNSGYGVIVPFDEIMKLVQKI